MPIQTPGLPLEHLQSLHDHELTYWWHLSRANRAERLVLGAFPAPSELRVVDLGCGTGGFLLEMNRRLGFRSALGVDVCPNALDFCARRGLPHIQTAPGDFRPLEQADLVFLMDVLEHVDEDGEFLSGALKALPDGGALLLSVPAHQGLYTAWDAGLGHRRRYSREGLAALARRAGARVLRMEYAFAVGALGILVQRKLLSLAKGTEGCEFPPVRPWLNSLLLGLNRAEAPLARWLPFGSSLFALLAKAPRPHRSKGAAT